MQNNHLQHKKSSQDYEDFLYIFVDDFFPTTNCYGLREVYPVPTGKMRVRKCGYCYLHAHYAAS